MSTRPELTFDDLFKDPKKEKDVKRSNELKSFQKSFADYIRKDTVSHVEAYNACIGIEKAFEVDLDKRNESLKKVSETYNEVFDRLYQLTLTDDNDSDTRRKLYKITQNTDYNELDDQNAIY